MILIFMRGVAQLFFDLKKRIYVVNKNAEEVTLLEVLVFVSDILPNSKQKSFDGEDMKRRISFRNGGRHSSPRGILL